MLIAAAAAALNLMAQNPNQVTGNCGQTVTITATPETGYEFVSWQDGNTDNPRQIVISSDSTIWTYTATFQAKTMTVTVSANEADWGTVTGGGSAQVGASMNISATPASGCYRFVRWSDGNTSASRTITVSAVEAENVYVAEFEEVSFDVTVVAGQHGTVSISIN